MRKFFIVLAALALTACGSMSGPGAYEAGLTANVQQYKLFSDGQLAQQQSISTCYQFNPNKSECSILAASTNAMQTLAGQPKPLRVAKSAGEIAESLLEKGFDATVKIFGIAAVRDVMTAQADAAREAAVAASAAQADVAQAGIEAASKPPLVVRPEVIQVPMGSAPVTTP